MKASKDLLVKGIAKGMAGILFFRTIPGTVAASETLSDPTEASVDYIETV